MAYLITKRAGEAQARRETIASLREPELVADLIQEMNRTIPRDGAMQVAETLRTERRATYGGDMFHASEI